MFLPTPSGRVRPLIAAIVDSYSRERYLDSSPWIIAALEAMGAKVEPFALTEERFAMRLLGFGPDLVWPMGLGAYAEDGRLQGFIETLLPGTPYVGSGVAASALGMDKEHFQAMCRELGIASPRTVCYTMLYHPHGRACRVSKPQDALFLTRDGQPFYRALAEHLGTPLIVKPLYGGASLDLAVVKSAEELETAFTNASRFGPVLVQEYIQGREFSVCILETHPDPLPIFEVMDALYDINSKVEGDSTRIPAEISHRTARQLHALAWAIHDYLGCHGFSRIDLKLDQDNRPVVLEINTNPGMIPNKSIFPQVCDVADLDYPTLIRHLVSTSLLPRRRNVPRLSTAQAVPFPAALRALLPDLPLRLQPPVYRTLAAIPAEEPLPVSGLRRPC